MDAFDRHHKSGDAQINITFFREFTNVIKRRRQNTVEFLSNAFILPI